MTFHLLSHQIRHEHDVVAARQRTREIAEVLGFDLQQQTRLATAVSEIARNAFCYSGGGQAEFFVDVTSSPQLFSISITDDGQGIQNLDQILNGTYQSATGMGLGIIGTKRLLDQFRIDTVLGKGTTVVLGNSFSRHAPPVTAQSLPVLLERISRLKPKTVLQGFQEQNQELLRTMNELRHRQDELTALNRELEDTNRGVVALYSELDDKANHLRRANEMKSRFLSEISHEFRTPLHSIQALSRLLLERIDGELTSEQDLQISYIRKSAESLSELVNDLLDIAKVEAGKIEIRPVEFSILNMFGTLRGMLKPLLVGSAIRLVFEVPAGIPPIYSDEARISQILRNFVSNALKFTEIGEVRVTAEYEQDSEFLNFKVQDSGIGITDENQRLVFEEFTQIDSHLQRKAGGTGLGLPLSRKLASLLGGEVSVQSKIGIGSTFALRIPRSVVDVSLPQILGRVSGRDPEPKPVLIIQDDRDTQLACQNAIAELNLRCVSAHTVQEAEKALEAFPPAAIVLDLNLQSEDAWEFLGRLKSKAATRFIPVIAVVAAGDYLKATGFGVDALLKPISGTVLSELLRKLTKSKPRKILLVDDQEASRYLNRQIFKGVDVLFTEAANGSEALELLKIDQQDLVIVDLAMPLMTGFQLIDAMQADTVLRGIPVVVVTSAILTPSESESLASRVIAILSKDKLLEPKTHETLAAALSSSGLSDLNRVG